LGKKRKEEKREKEREIRKRRGTIVEGRKRQQRYFTSSRLEEGTLSSRLQYSEVEGSVTTTTSEIFAHIKNNPLQIAPFYEDITSQSLKKASTNIIALTRSNKRNPIRCAVARNAPD
jgi:trehalose/maltose hydrolase-like predicted phosphorylase